MLVFVFLLSIFNVFDYLSYIILIYTVADLAVRSFVASATTARSFLLHSQGRWVVGPLLLYYVSAVKASSF